MESAKVHNEIVPDTVPINKTDTDIVLIKETETVERVGHDIVPTEETEVLPVESGKVDHEITTVEIVNVESGKVDHEIVPVEETETVTITRTIDTVERIDHEIVPVKEIEIVTLESGKVDHEIVPIEETEIVTVKSGTVNHEIVPVEEPETVAKDTIATNVTTNVTKITWDIEKEKSDQERERRPSICGQITQIILRVLLFGSMAAACLIMLFKEQTVEIAGFRIRASYRVSPAFKFFVYGTGAVAIYSMISVSMVYCRYRAKSVHILDTLMMALAIASASAATAVGYIAKFGNDETGWTKSCDYYKTYCLQSTVSIGCAYIGFICLLIICIMSSNTPQTTRTK